ncbi:hypothetical protein FB451DRAFT_1447647 [Mycena latifolia]|nr:hypothetical protein FB451DRAFT_1447647 [Mycena latifolia]
MMRRRREEGRKVEEGVCRVEVEGEHQARDMGDRVNGHKKVASEGCKDDGTGRVHADEGHAVPRRGVAEAPAGEGGGGREGEPRGLAAPDEERGKTKEGGTRGDAPGGEDEVGDNEEAGNEGADVRGKRAGRGRTREEVWAKQKGREENRTEGGRRKGMGEAKGIQKSRKKKEGNEKCDSPASSAFHLSYHAQLSNPPRLKPHRRHMARSCGPANRASSAHASSALVPCAARGEGGIDEACDARTSSASVVKMNGVAGPERDSCLDGVDAVRAREKIDGIRWTSPLQRGGQGFCFLVVRWIAVSGLSTAPAPFPLSVKLQLKSQMPRYDSCASLDSRSSPWSDLGLRAPSSLFRQEWTTDYGYRHAFTIKILPQPQWRIRCSLASGTGRFVPPVWKRAP